MILKNAIFPAALLTFSPAVFAASYHSDFSGANFGDPLEGVDGWTQSEPNVDPRSPLAFIGNLRGEKAGAVGPFYDAPTGTSFSASRPVSLDFASSNVILEFGINDSTTDFASRNNFSFTIGGPADANLFTVSFAPQSQTGDYDNAATPSDPALNNSMWDVHWTSDGALLPSAPFAAVLEDGLYSLSFQFSQNGNDVNFIMVLDSGTPGNEVFQTGTLVGLGGAELTSLNVGNDMGSGAAWGDNFMAFQVQAVPEPGSMLLLSLVGFGFLRRRR